MLQRIREQVGTAGLVVAIIALVAALGGAAYAAGGGLSGKQKKEVKAIAKGFQGTGPAGPQGVPGANGAKGDAGAKGDTGQSGSSVKVTATTGAQCGARGGVIVEKEGGPAGAEVCTGKEGKEGKEGSPWTAGGVLPPGAVETGAWAVSGTPADEKAYGSLPFSIPLSAAIESTHVHYVTGAEISAQSNAFCKAFNAGSPAVEEIAPAPGELCVYEGGSSENATFGGIFGVDLVSEGVTRAGGALSFTFSAPGYVGGSFAVTGCQKEGLPPGDPNKCPA